MGYYWQKGERFWDPSVETDEGEPVWDTDEDNDDDTNKYSNFKDSAAFLAALELYNRNCNTQWECYQVAAEHRTPCDACEKQFVYDPYLSATRPRFYCRYKTTRPRVTQKLCTLCMDSKLYTASDNTTDIASIRSKLLPLREKQRNTGMGRLFVTDYERQYPNYASLLTPCLADNTTKSNEDYELRNGEMFSREPLSQATMERIQKRKADDAEDNEQQEYFKHEGKKIRKITEYFTTKTKITTTTTK